MEQTARLFIGLEPDEASRRKLKTWSDELQTVLSGRFYEAGLYHVTLAFLGQTDRTKIPLLAGLLHRAASPFEVEVDRLDAFKDGKILYAGVVPSPELMRLQQDLAGSLRDAGFSLEDAPYIPHITLARHGGGFTQPLPAPDIHFTATAVTLFESTRMQDRLCYLPLVRVPLESGRNSDES